MVVYYRITDSHADYYDVSVIPIAAFRRHALWWADYQLQGNLSQTSCLNVALRTTFSMNRHMQALDILSIIIFILGAIVETYATHKTKKYIWHFMSFLCFHWFSWYQSYFTRKKISFFTWEPLHPLFAQLHPDINYLHEHRHKHNEINYASRD